MPNGASLMERIGDGVALIDLGSLRHFGLVLTSAAGRRAVAGMRLEPMRT